MLSVVVLSFTYTCYKAFSGWDTVHKRIEMSFDNTNYASVLTKKKVVEIFHNQKDTRNPDKKKIVSRENSWKEV